MIAATGTKSDPEWFCPICKKPIEEGARFFPFCGEQCKLIDLGRWLDGKYIQRLEPESQPPDDSEDFF